MPNQDLKWQRRNLLRTQLRRHLQVHDKGIVPAVDNQQVLQIKSSTEPSSVVSLHSNTIQKTMTKQNKTDPTPKRAQNSFSQLFTKFANLLHSNQPCPRRQALNLADH